MSLVYAQKNLTDDTTDAFDSVVTILLAGLDTVAFQLAGTFAGTVQFEASTGGDTWASVSVTPSAGGAAVTSATGTGIWAADGCAGYYAVRARCSTYTSGTIIASIGAGASSVAADVSVAAAGALGGVGSMTDPLTVNVDGSTIGVNGSNELAVLTTAGFLHQATVTLTDDNLKHLVNTKIEIIPAPGPNLALLPYPAGGALYSTQSVAYTNVDTTAQFEIVMGGYAFPVTSAVQTTAYALLTFGGNAFLPFIFVTPPSGTTDDPSVFVNQPCLLDLANAASGEITGGNASNSVLFSVSYLVLNTATGVFV